MAACDEALGGELLLGGQEEEGVGRVDPAPDPRLLGGGLAAGVVPHRPRPAGDGLVVRLAVAAGGVAVAAAVLLLRELLRALLLCL